jgi:hypothetical protein
VDGSTISICHASAADHASGWGDLRRRLVPADRAVAVAAYSTSHGGRALPSSSSVPAGQPVSPCDFHTYCYATENQLTGEAVIKYMQDRRRILHGWVG